MEKFDCSILSNPSINYINALKPFSDHKFFLPEESFINETKMKLSLNGYWDFFYAKNLAQSIDEFSDMNYKTENWDKIRVPGHIELQGYGKPQYVNTMYPWDGIEDVKLDEVPTENNSVGHYVKYFDIPKDWSKERVFISFEGVESAIAIWLNGKFVGYSEDSFTPTRFDLSSYLVDGKNKLAAKVFKYSSGSWLEDQDFWRFSGIMRDVFLYTTPETHIEDLFIKTILDDTFENSKLDLKIKFNNKKNNFIQYEFYDMESKLILSGKKESVDGEINFTENINKPILWSAENPYLYIMNIKVFDESKEQTEYVFQKIGFRKIEIKNKLILINGKRLLLNGVNRHEFSCDNGRCITKEEMLADILTMKQNNINALRCSHYPNNSYIYELCDQFGIYVFDEVNMETHGTWMVMGKVIKSEKNLPDDKKEWLGAVIKRVEAVFERDKNHPSVIFWSLGNESYGGENIFEMSKRFKELDDTRPIHYEGLFHDRRFNNSSDVESRMYAKVGEIVEYLEDNPEKPFIHCEYSHAMNNSLGGMYEYTELSKKYEMFQGGFIWDYIDQSLKIKNVNGEEFFAYGGDFGDRPTDYNFCTNGLVFSDRTISPKMQEVKYNYQYFEFEIDEAEIKIKNKNLFVGTENYFLLLALEKDGQTVFQNAMEIFINPQEEKTFKHGLENYLIDGEYAITAYMMLKKSCRWAMEGFIVAHSQKVIKKELINKISKSKKSVKLINGDCNIGIKGDNYHAIISKVSGKIVSYKLNGLEMILKPAELNFWRAPVDNDIGNKSNVKYSPWKVASLYNTLVSIEIIDFENPRIKAIFSLIPNTEAKCEVIYFVNDDGNLNVETNYKKVEGLETLPEFGMIFKLPLEFSNVEFYGNGPEENYIDRKEGTLLSIYKTNIFDNYVNYSTPQECGNRTGIRYIKITNNKNLGLMFKSKNEMNGSFLAFTPHELENAGHAFELPKPYESVIKISANQMGVGGDDSWGAPVHKHHLLNIENEIKFSFEIIGIE